MDTEEEKQRLKGQVEIWEHMFAFVDSMALKCAVELGIPDIINSHGHPITISEIINNLPATTSSSSPNVDYLTRVLRLLVRKRIFSSQIDQETDQIYYDLTPSSKWLLRDSKFSLAPFVLAQLDPPLQKPWQYMGKCVEEGGFAFEKAHGVEIWDFSLANPQFNNLFNDAMRCTTEIIINAVLVKYKDGFNGIESLVDVGGGTGMMITEIVKEYPHIKAPEQQGVEHIGGDMFVHIPEADAVIMKWIMHDWGDEDCVKILRNCCKAIAKKKNGKVVIVDCVLRPDGDGSFDNTGLAFDLLMIAHASGGKERTEVEWRMLLNNAGFPRCNIIQIPAFPSIIEAFPE
ncbi:(R,S)-reticuline 7-O-methyltransferase-like isoform X2 [Papaver somniferum]|uniref:(R,S)-reticuline 7-O-methyltransferase-like isoform X2 n=1 Tax=Papaver somniferum TaxID=3469 RepID=UPI000E6F76CE|nr:(R,S)-reticuline 7-O-methyltransferase-like isoform X2 [Papaver somniferum]